jgi:hypothetical protein
MGSGKQGQRHALLPWARIPGYFDAEDASDGSIGVDAVSAPGGLVPLVASVAPPSVRSAGLLVLAASRSSRWRGLMQASTMRCKGTPP